MRTFLQVLFLLSSCVTMLPRHLTDEAFYSIDDASVRLITKLDDTLYRTDYEKQYNLPGKYYANLSTVNAIDTTQAVGVQIKLWATIVRIGEGTYYGEFPKNGLLEKIDTLTIGFVGENNFLDITPLLKGDSTIREMKWRKCDYKKLPYTWG